MASMDASKPQGKYVLRNYWEASVMEKTRAILAKMDICECEKCFIDVCALALNQLTPRYVTTDRGSLIQKLPELSSKAELELTVLITKCAKMVHEKPMH